MPALPPVAGTQNALIHSAAGGPALTDLGIAGTVAGCVITDLRTTFPFTQDTYFDAYMQPQVDVCYGFQFEMEFNTETHLRGQAATSTDMGIPSVQMGTMVSEELVYLLTVNDTRGFATGTGTGPNTLWPNGTKFIVSNGGGTFERQKIKKDAIKLAFRRYATT